MYRTAVSCKLVHTRLFLKLKIKGIFCMKHSAICNLIYNASYIISPDIVCVLRVIYRVVSCQKVGK